MTSISGVEFVQWALPITTLIVVSGLVLLNKYSQRIEKWGKKHIHKRP
jgi:hypothetical protein